MDTPRQPVVVLSRALDQAGDVLADIHSDDLEKPTPCADWTVRDLADHLAAIPARFLAMTRGDKVDWSAAPEIEEGAWATEFRTHADDLIHHWHTQDDDALAQADFQSAELGVHTWDLERALGRTTPLDDEVAERGLAFLQEGLTGASRGSAFGPPVEVGDDATPYDRLAAFAGRDPGWTA